MFEVKNRAARKARNPRTGERVDVEAKFVVTFKPGKDMEEKVPNFRNPEKYISQRIENEIRESEQKYRLIVR